MQTITCPSCSSEFTKRVRRNTRIGRALAIFYIYPFRCQLCERAFKIFQPGIRHIRMDEDRRDHHRISIDFPAWLKKDIVNSSGSATEISMKGCTIRTDSRLPLMSLVSVGLEVPQRPQPLTIETAVVRNSAPGRIGLEFLRFHGDERRRPRHFPEGLLKNAPG